MYRILRFDHVKDFIFHIVKRNWFLTMNLHLLLYSLKKICTNILASIGMYKTRKKILHINTRTVKLNHFKTINTVCSTARLHKSLQLFVPIIKFDFNVRKYVRVGLMIRQTRGIFTFNLHVDVLLCNNQWSNRKNREHFSSLTLKKKFSEKTLRYPTCFTSRILNR